MQWSIMDFLSTEGFRPHGLCLQWRADVFWAHIISDVLIALSYFSIPVALVYFAFHRTDFNYRWVLYLFGTFIVACGITHAFGIWTMWVPDYGMQAVAKGMTALVSVATAVALWPLMPRLLAIPSTLELAQKNEALAEEIATREHVEQELRHLNNELELRVSDRTAQLEQRNADLVTAQRAAEKSSAAKSEFLASMSHEVRTPMNGVLGMLDLLQGARLSSDEQEMVRRAKYAADGLLEVINDILDYSKLEAGSVELSRHPFSPAQTVSDVVAMLQSRAGQKGLTLSCVLPEDLPPRVLGDERRFRQVLVNLVGNAIKFTPAGTVSVHVVRTGQSTTKGTGQSKMQGTEEDMGQDASVGLAVGVSDTGIGIDPKAAGNLFQRFQQADPSISRRFGGTGLGLAISKQLVELMGGNISVESNPGEGSIFTFTAAFEPCSEQDAPAGGTVKGAGTTASQRLRILLAEDNETNRFHLVRLLGDAGHAVESVENGSEAIAAAEREQFDIILMDIYMPEMDGTVAAKIIRTLDGPSARTPIVALTANAMVGDREHYLSTGMDEYVSKPVDAGVLLSTIWRVVHPHRHAVGAA